MIVFQVKMTSPALKQTPLLINNVGFELKLNKLSYNLVIMSMFAPIGAGCQQFLIWHHKHGERLAGDGSWGRCAAPLWVFLDATSTNCSGALHLNFPDEKLLSGVQQFFLYNLVIIIGNTHPRYQRIFKIKI